MNATSPAHRTVGWVIFTTPKRRVKMSTRKNGWSNSPSRPGAKMRSLRFLCGALPLRAEVFGIAMGVIADQTIFGKRMLLLSERLSAFCFVIALTVIMLGFICTYFYRRPCKGWFICKRGMEDAVMAGMLYFLPF